MSWTLMGFWIVAIVSVVTGLGVVSHPNPVRSALFLVVNFACLAILYITLNAQLLAMLQVLVYAGAIMVLFLFVIMLLNLGGEQSRADPLGVWHRITALVLGLALLTGIIWAVNDFAGRGPVASAEASRAQNTLQGFPQIQVIGWTLFTRYVYPFELTSILLLIGAIGVILLTKRDSSATNTVSPSANAHPSP
jgi:NADH-quinone oxidoreductase subunit J